MYNRRSFPAENQRFPKVLDGAQQRQIYVVMEISICELYVWSKDRCCHNKELFPHDSQVSQSGKQNCHHRHSHYHQVTVYQLSWVHQRNVVHQGARFLSHQWICMYRKSVRVASNLLFINVYFINQWVISYRTIQSQMSVCVWRLF